MGNTLKDFAPAALLIKQALHHAEIRAAKSYAKRVDSLGHIENVFNDGVQVRPQRKRSHHKNESSCGSIITQKRFGNTTIVCRTTKF